jgi:hypothetical protein
MFGIEKRTVYKVLKSKSEVFSDLVLLERRPNRGAVLFVRISRYRSAKMLLVHADGISLRMVVTWPGLLLFFCLV